MDSSAPLLQPDFHQLNQHLTGESEQIGRIPNMPAVVGMEALEEQHHQLLAQQAQQHAAALAKQAQQHADFLAKRAQQHADFLAKRAQQHQELIDRLDALEKGQRLLPMQLLNATGSLQAPLQYPPNVVVGDQFPKTKYELLFKITAADAQVVSQALGLPPLPANSPVAARQQQIIDFLGCAMIA